MHRPPHVGPPTAIRPRAAVALALVLCPGLTLAHYPWMSPADYSPPAGQPVAFSIGVGHHFPGTDTIAGERLAAAELLDAAGQVRPVALGSGNEFLTPALPGEGPWVLAARIAPGYYSRTPQGGQRVSRAEAPDAMSCGHSSNTVKALLGAGDGAVAQPLGHPLEIVPLAANPSTGAPFAVKALRAGVPWQGEINAVYAGFGGAEDQYPVKVVTDAEGLAKLEFDRPGRWMIKAYASEPYPDPATCDRSNFTATLTLVVR